MINADRRSSRTYGGNEGEDIREGFEPNDSSAVVDPNDGNDGTNEAGFAVGDDEDAGDSPGAEESREWKKASEPEVLLKPKYGVEGEEFENVWGSDGPLRENP